MEDWRWCAWWLVLWWWRVVVAAAAAAVECVRLARSVAPLVW